MEALMLTPGGLLLTAVVLAIVASSLRSLWQPRPTVIYMPLEHAHESRNSGCLPFLVLLGVILAALMGMF
ncbi:hypothetical protein [Candidatus Viridilinea mediisalina]|uniref:Uncharacterized protein n=1 Tax=Candidatus Viridilinea mediisalina TaxID=2024553 RepID=A0A2A6RNV8_9CHLR|nr:hypothetical protein [Candidatus Viridilinea mediisalina]PDW04549.1 hypothetical protein CJ255_03280 [Candidatus Viridilinea mediisalina]